MPINPMIPLMVGQGVPQVKTLSEVMTDVARVKTAEAQARRMDALSRQEADAELRRKKAEGLFKQYGSDPSELSRQLYLNEMPLEGMAWDKHVTDTRAKVAQTVSAGLAMQKAIAAVTAGKLETINDEASYNFVMRDIAANERDALQPGQPGLASEFAGMTYEQAMSSGTIERMKKFVRAQAAASASQISAFGAFSKENIPSLGAIHGMYATTTNQKDVDDVNQVVEAYGVSSEIRNTLPRAWTEGLAEKHRQLAEMLQNAKAPGGAKTGSREEYLAKYLPPNYTQEQYDATVKRFEALNDSNQGDVRLERVRVRVPGSPDPITANFNSRTGKYSRQDGTELPNAELVEGASGLSATSTDDMAEQLVRGNLVPSMLSKRTANYNEILARANAISMADTGTPYNAANMQIQYGAATRFVSSLNGPQLTRFRGLGISVVNTIDEVKTLANELDLGGVTWANQVELDAKLKLLGNSEQGQLVARYVGAVNTLKEEFANLINGGYAPTEAAFALANRQVNEGYGAKAMNASLTEVQRLINFRLAAFEQIQPAGLQPGNPFFTPTSASTAQTFTATTTDGRIVTFPSLADRDAAVKEGPGILKATVAPPAADTTDKVDWIWDPKTKTMKKVGG